MGLSSTRWWRFTEASINKLAQERTEKTGLDSSTRRGSIGINPQTTFDSSAMDKVAGARMLDIHSFKETKLPSGGKLGDLTKELNANTKEANNVRGKIKAALENPAFDELQKNFKALSEDFKDLAQRVPDPYLAGDIIDYMTREVGDTRTKLVDMQTKAYEQLEKELNDPGFKKDFIEASGVAPEDYEQVKKNMLEDLKASQTKQLQEFDSSKSESLKKIYDSAKNHQRELGLIEATSIDNEKQRQNILAVQQAYNKKHKIENTSHVDLDGTGNELKISGIRIQDFERLYTNSGKEIANKNGTWTISYGIMDRLKFYSNPFHDNLKADLMLMAQAVKAGNPEDGITMNIKGFHNDEKSREKARVAVQACIDAGYPLDKINIQINGQPINLMYKKAEKDKPEELDPQALYANNREEYQSLSAQAKKVAEESSNFKPVFSNQGQFDDIKKEVTKLREERAKPKPQSPDEPSRQSSFTHS